MKLVSMSKAVDMKEHPSVNHAAADIQDNEDDNGETSKHTKVQEKIRSKMVSRLKEDSYISKLLQVKCLVKSKSKSMSLYLFVNL